MIYCIQFIVFSLFISSIFSPSICTDDGRLNFETDEPNRFQNLPKCTMQGNLIPNPSFEEGDDVPMGWEHSNYSDGINYNWDSTIAHSGEKSVGISNVENMIYNGMWRFYGWITTGFIPMDIGNYTYEYSIWCRYLGKPEENQYGEFFSIH